MTSTILCHVVSAEEEIYSGEVQMVSARGDLGELGIMPGHTPLLSPLVPGPVIFKNAEGEEEIIYVSGGMLEVLPKEVTILADTAIRAHDVDEAAALEAQKDAEQALAHQSSEMDYSSAMIMLAEAAAQLRTIQALKKKMGG